MADAINANQLLPYLKNYLDQELSQISVYLFKTANNNLKSIQLLSHLDNQNCLLEKIDSLNPEGITKTTFEDEHIYNLLVNDSFNQNDLLQNKLVSRLHGLIDDQLRISCFQLPEFNFNSYWCLLSFKNTQSNISYVTKYNNEILILVNLMFSHLIRLDTLKQLQSENDLIQEELKQIANLQRLLLPQDDLKIKGIDIAANFRACEHAGGDYYDLVALGDNLEPSMATDESQSWGVMIADSAGHGAAAAVEISMFDAILRTINPSNSNINAGPAGVFDYTNQFLFTRLIRGTFITSFVAGYDPKTESIDYACAGHPPGIMYRYRNKELIELNLAGGIPLGVVKEYTWENSTIAFNKNDLLVLYTDGILEAENDNGEQFGIDRLKNIISSNSNLNVKTLLTLIEATVDDFQSNRARKDDQTLVLLKRLH